MTHRVIVYDAALPQTTDILNTAKFGLIGQSFGMRAILGGGTVVHGLVCSPTTPTADLHVTVDVGSIYQQDPIDSTPYGDLGADTRVVLKQGIMDTAVQLLLIPPATPGFSQVYLIQAILNDVDAGSVVLPYYNPTNPQQPYSGPNNAGTAQFTLRQVKCIIAVKAGSPATTGSQVVPSPDAGYVGLYAITLANGQTQITGASIATLDSAPFFPTLPSVPSGVQNSRWVYAVDTGTANVMVAKVLPPVLSLVPGLNVLIKAAFGNTGAATLNLNGLGAVAIHRANGSALSSGDYNAGNILHLCYDGSSFQLVNFSGFTATTTNNNNFTIGIPYATDTGATNALAATFSPAVTGLSAGNIFEVKVGHTNTGPATLACNALAAVPIVDRFGAPLAAGDLAVGQVAIFIYDGTNFQLEGFTASDIGPLKIPRNFQQISISTRTKYYGITGVIQVLSGTYNKQSPTSNVIFWYTGATFTPNNPWNLGAGGLTLTIGGVARQGINSNSTMPDARGQTALNGIISGLPAGSLAWTTQIGDLVSSGPWVSVVNPTSVDQPAFLPPISWTTLVIAEIEP